MELGFHHLFQPATALPFSQDRAYFEVPPGKRLEPYIQCFWGGDLSGRNGQSLLRQNRLIIPDGCRDLILTIHGERICGRLTDLDLKPCRVSPKAGEEQRTFGVRFYFWAASCFGGEGMLGNLLPLLEKVEFAHLPFAAQCGFMRNYLEQRIRSEALPGGVQEAAGLLLESRGSISVRELERQTFQSRRTLERRFLREFGVSPKAMAGVIRYQSLWRDILCKKDFDIQDEVAALGFYDQAHLLHSFSDYHGMTISQAIQYSKTKNDAFLQAAGPQNGL